MKRFLFCLVAAVGLLPSCADEGDFDDPGAPIVLPGRDAGADDGGGSACTLGTEANCSRCGDVCPSGPRGTAACSAGRCVLACDEGWGDCNGSATDGCETALDGVEACGACGRDCRACGGTSCTNGTCDPVLVATAATDIALLAASSDRVTYADRRSVVQVPKTGAGSFSVYDVVDTPGLLVDDAVYFILPGTDFASGIYRTTADFIGPQIASFARGENVQAMALDETGVYFASDKSSGVNRLARCKDCSVATELSATENLVRQNAICLDATTVFYGAGDMIRKVDKIGGNPTTLAVGQSPRSLVADDSALYWVNEAPFTFPGEDAGTSGSVMRMPKAGGAPSVVASKLVDPRHLRLAEGRLYVTDAGTGTLYRLGKDGRERITLARGVTKLGGLAIDESCVWYSDGPRLQKMTR